MVSHNLHFTYHTTIKLKHLIVIRFAKEGQIKHLSSSIPCHLSSHGKTANKPLLVFWHEDCTHLNDFCVWSWGKLLSLLVWKGHNSPHNLRNLHPNTVPYHIADTGLFQQANWDFLARGRCWREWIPGVTQFQLLPHGVPPAAACCLKSPWSPQTSSERALKLFFHPLHWQRRKKPDNHIMTSSCHPGHGSPNVQGGPIHLHSSLLHRGQLGQDH